MASIWASAASGISPACERTGRYPSSLSLWPARVSWLVPARAPADLLRLLLLDVGDGWPQEGFGMFGITELRPVLHASLQSVTQLMLSRTVMPGQGHCHAYGQLSSPRRSPRAVWSYLSIPCAGPSSATGWSIPKSTRTRARFAPLSPRSRKRLSAREQRPRPSGDAITPRG